MKRKKMPRVAVIGAGFGGLSAAIRIAAAGCEVDLFDKRTGPGGKAGTERHAGYRFDTGPSLVTMPEVFTELFDIAEERVEDHVGFVELPVICRYFWDDGTRFDASSDRDRFLSEVTQKTIDPPEALTRYLAYSRRIYRAAGDLFLRHSLHDARTYLGPAFWRSLLRVGQIDPWRTMDEANKSFFADPKLRQLFNRYATYNGSSPYLTPATLNIIPHVEYNRGAYAARDGIYSFPAAFEKLARKVGVSIHYATPVERISVEPFRRGSKAGRVTGIRVAGRELFYDAVVTNADVTATYRDMLDDPEDPELVRYEGLEPSSSGVVFYWGMKRQFPELTVNNIFFSDNYPEEFDAIFSRRTLGADPTVYVNITSKVTPSDAPPGGENWFVLVNAPYDDGQPWDRLIPELRRKVIAKLDAALGRSIEESLEWEGVMSPRGIAERTGSYRGSLYGISSNNRSAAFARHPNFSRRYRGLYFCGGSVHPGGGMPLAILSGKIAAELLLRRS